MKLAPLKGYNALQAFNAFHRMMLGLKMIPLYQNEDYQTFYERLDEKTESEKRAYFLDAVRFVDVTKEEFVAMVSFACDKNGIPFSNSNIKSLEIPEMVNIIIEVSLAICAIKVPILNEDEKKN